MLFSGRNPQIIESNGGWMRGSSLRCFIALSVLFSLGAAAQSQEQDHVSVVSDWTHHYAIYPDTPYPDLREQLQKDPRFQNEWYARHPEMWWLNTKRHHRPSNGSKRDWSVSLGATAETAIRQTFPAKFVYNVTGTPSCANDYVVAGIPVAGSTTQATLIAVNNLYSGTLNSTTGVCGTAPTVLFAYNVRTGYMIRSSVVPSLDGTKIAFVDYSATGSEFHVLTWKAGEGTSATAPATPTASEMVSFALGTYSTNTVFVDFYHDAAYVTAGTVMYKFSPVFNGTPAEVTTGGWPLTFGGASLISTPVYDQVTRHVFVEDTNGTVWYADDSGSTSVVGTNSWAFATADGGHPPIVDTTNQKIYVYSSNGTTGSILGQADETLSTASRVTVNVGASGTGVVPESPDFNNAYYSGTLTGSALYQVGQSSSSGHTALFDVGFSTGWKMNANTANGPIDIATNAVENSPITEFYNSTLSKDFLFIGTYDNCEATGVTGGCVRAIDITAGFPTSVNPGTNSNAILAAGGGTSGIVVDNNSSESEASSIYYFTLGTAGSTCGPGNYCLVKATQSGLK